MQFARKTSSDQVEGVIPKEGCMVATVMLMREEDLSKIDHKVWAGEGERAVRCHTCKSGNGTGNSTQKGETVFSLSRREKRIASCDKGSDKR